ncbi:phosphotransferase family protein [Streptomyces sp. NPDC101151]|uniref:phosphotransferase family protein n=1 Tax=Streptomyces sp. NPDC101151 TaxID=3366115 RepID=UPI0038035F66
MGERAERARRVLAAAGIGPGRPAGVRPLGGGTCTTVEELRLTDGGRCVLKTAPTAPGLRYEVRLLRSEAEFGRAAAEAGVPAPRTLHADDTPQVRHLPQTACPGAPWDDSITDTERAAPRREPGGHVAPLRRVTGPGFGCPTGALGPPAPDRRTAFTTMFEAVLDDARRYRARLPRPADGVTRTARAALDPLDEVTVPRPVHFELWRGNVLVDRTPDGPRIGGLVDGERMFRGDPLADFVSLVLLDDIEKDEAFLAGHRQGGGRAAFGRAEGLRIALCRAYRYVIMLVETVPRAVDEEHARRVQKAVAPELVAALGVPTAAHA